MDTDRAKSRQAANARQRTLDRRGIVLGIAAIIYLSLGEHMPDRDRDASWLIVEASDSGRFFGTGSA